MWTPRRLLLLLLGLAFFGTAYGVYARFLGGIDGLPLLPEEYLVRRTGDSKEVVTPVTEPEINRKLRQAFGGDLHDLVSRFRDGRGKAGRQVATNADQRRD